MKNGIKFFKKSSFNRIYFTTEDLEDLNIIKKNYDLIEEYDFREIINKYNLENSIICINFKESKRGKVLSKNE